MNECVGDMGVRKRTVLFSAFPQQLFVMLWFLTFLQAKDIFYDSLNFCCKVINLGVYPLYLNFNVFTLTAYSWVVFKIPGLMELK